MSDIEFSPYRKLLITKLKLEHLLNKIKDTEANDKLSVSDKFSRIKIIKEEMNKIKHEIDTIKKEIKLLKTYNIN